MIDEKLNEVKKEEPKDKADDSPEEPQTDMKKIKRENRGFIITALFIIILIAAAFFLVDYYGGNHTKDLDNAVDKLHKLNFEGKLPESKGYFYNGFSFVERDGIWYTRYQEDNTIYGIALHYGPNDLKDIPVKGVLDPKFSLFENVSVDFDPTDKNLTYLALANGELSMHIVKVLHKRTIPACSQNVTGCENTEIIPLCKDPMKDKAVIFLSQADGPEIDLMGTCVILKGKGEDLLKSIDFLLYRWLKIM